MTNSHPLDPATRYDAGSESVLQLFNEFKDEILSLIDQGEAYKRGLKPLDAQIEPFFHAARRELAASRLNLTVIGPEGAGKSTLINAIAGDKLTPESRKDPGTVAPTYLEWGPSKAPNYTVQFKDKKEPLVCRTLDEFNQYILQVSNDQNHKRVACGYIRLDHPALRNGLRFVDVPGTGGVSGAVHTEAVDFIKHESHAVILVVRGRLNYKLAGQLLNMLIDDEKRVHAIVFNSDTSDFTGFDSDAELLSDLDDTRGRVVHNLNTSIEESRGTGQVSNGLRLTRPDLVYVLHLPTVFALRRGEVLSEARHVTHPPHSAEAARFNQNLWQYIKANGLCEIVVRAAGKAHDTNRELIRALSLRRRVLAAILGGDPSTHARIIEDFRAAQARAEAEWDAYTDAASITDVAQRHWAESIYKRANDARDNIRGKVNGVRENVKQRSGKISKEIASSINAELAGYVEKELAEIHRVEMVTKGEILQGYCNVATKILMRTYERVPALSATVGPEQIPITPEKIFDLETQEMEPSALARIRKWAAISGVAAIAGSLAGGGGHFALLAATGLMGPWAAFFWGAVGAAVLGYWLYNWVTDDYRDAVNNELKRCQEQAEKFDLSHNGEIFITWSSEVEAIAAKVGGILRWQLQQMAALIEQSEGGGAQLEADIAQLDDALRALNELNAKLDNVGEKAVSAGSAALTA